MSNDLHNQVLRTTIEDSQRFAFGRPGQEKAFNIRFDDYVALLQGLITGDISGKYDKTGGQINGMLELTSEQLASASSLVIEKNYIILSDNTTDIESFDYVARTASPIIYVSAKKGQIFKHNQTVAGTAKKIFLSTESDFTVPFDMTLCFIYNPVADAYGDVSGIAKVIESGGGSQAIIAEPKNALVDTVPTGNLFISPGWAIDYFDNCSFVSQGTAVISFNANQDNIQVDTAGSLYDLTIFEPDGTTVKHYFPFVEAPRLKADNTVVLSIPYRLDAENQQVYEINYDGNAFADFFYLQNNGSTRVESSDNLNIFDFPYNQSKVKLYDTSLFWDNVKQVLIAQDDQGVEYFGVWGDGTYIYTVNLNSLFAYTFDGTALSLVGSIGSTNARYVWGDGTYIYVTTNSSQLLAYTFDGATFTQVGSIATPTNSYRMYHDGSYLYVGVINTGLTAYSFNGSTFTAIATALGAVCESVSGDGTYIYTAQNDVLYALTFNGATFTTVASITSPVAARTFDIHYRDGYIYTAQGNELKVYTFDGATFTEVERITGLPDSRTVSSLPNYVMVGMGASGVNLFTFDGTNAVSVDIYDIAEVGDIYAENDSWFYVGDRPAGLTIRDIKPRIYDRDETANELIQLGNTYYPVREVATGVWISVNEVDVNPTDNIDIRNIINTYIASIGGSPGDKVFTAQELIDLGIASSGDIVVEFIESLGVVVNPGDEEANIGRILFKTAVGVIVVWTYKEL